MSGAARRRLDASPRRRVRWVYLLDEWPEAEAVGDHAEAILAAPPDAVIAALTRDVDKYGEVIQAERARAAAAVAELDQLQAALALVLGTAARLAEPLDLAPIGGPT